MMGIIMFAPRCMHIVFRGAKNVITQKNICALFLSTFLLRFIIYDVVRWLLRKIKVFFKVLVYATFKHEQGMTGY